MQKTKQFAIKICVRHSQHIGICHCQLLVNGQSKYWQLLQASVQWHQVAMAFVIYHKLSNIPTRWASTALSTLGGARVDPAKQPSLPTFFHTDLNLSLAIHHYPSCLNHKLLCSDTNYFSSDKGSSALPHFLLRFIHIYISSFSWAILYICVPKAMLGLETDTVLWLVHSSTRGFQLTFRISQYIFLSHLKCV